MEESDSNIESDDEFIANTQVIDLSNSFSDKCFEAESECEK